MTTEKLVNDALFGKTKLASVKIELGLIDDIQKDLDAGAKLLSESLTKATLASNNLKRATLSAKDGVEKAKFLGLDASTFQSKLDAANELFVKSEKIKSL
jgi:hypothetical protein